MPKIQKNKIEQCTKIFIYRDLKQLQILFLVLNFYKPAPNDRFLNTCYTWRSVQDTFSWVQTECIHGISMRNSNFPCQFFFYCRLATTLPGNQLSLRPSTFQLWDKSTCLMMSLRSVFIRVSELSTVTPNLLFLTLAELSQ